MTVEKKIAMLESNLGRILGFISTADNKVTTVFALDTAMLGVLAALTPQAGCWSTFLIIFAVVAATALIVSIIMITLTSFPRTNGPVDSLIYFGSISKRDINIYQKDILTMSLDEYISDLSKQCHINATIADIKYKWIRRATISLYLAVIPWFLYLYYTYQLR